MSVVAKPTAGQLLIVNRRCLFWDGGYFVLTPGDTMVVTSVGEGTVTVITSQGCVAIIDHYFRFHMKQKDISVLTDDGVSR